MQNFDAKALTEKVSALEEKLASYETVLAKLIPLLPVLVEKYAGSVAGEGGTLESGAIIPATELGRYEDKQGA